MSDAKSICEEVKAFYHERYYSYYYCPLSSRPTRLIHSAAAEEEYAKKLLKISKMSLGTKECGTLKASLVSVKTELEAMGNAHAEVAAGMRRELEEAVISTSNLIREKRKLVGSLASHSVADDRFKPTLTS
jgi:Fes/CIP4, and EFC/F-BAR homology domain